VKAVNLLPEKNRPRRPTGGQSRSAHIALGVLGALLIAVVVYVLTLNSINDSKTKITEAKAEAVRLEAQAGSLGPYGDFAKIKAERVASVMQYAQQRFDWERLVRELASVLPSDVWLVNASASASGGDPTSTAASGTPAPAAPGAATAVAAGPTLSIQGCARDQQEVAVTLVRLRELQGATDVSLDHSTRGQDTTGSAPSAAPAAGSGAADTGCGTTHGIANYSFQANVTFAATEPVQKPGSVPNRLGGGS
jgi:Tfp pilus assembly protein PilN